MSKKLVAAPSGARGARPGRRGPWQAVRALATIGVVAGMALVFVPGALAAGPEAPETISPAGSISNTMATLEGTVDPHATSPTTVSWYFDYAAGAVCTGEASTSVRGPREVEVEHATAVLGGLQPGTLYTFCLVVSNEAGEVTVGSPVQFTTTALAPTIESESFSNVGSAGAQLQATIDDYGSPGEFHVNYGTSAGYGDATASESLGAIGESTIVTVPLEGLGAETAYDFQFVVENPLGTAPGTNESFSTLPGAFLGLPDGRVYEMVTPANNANADVYVPNAGQFPVDEGEGIYTTYPFQASIEGDAVAYPASPTSGLEGGNGSEGTNYGNEYLAVRSSSGGWEQSNLQPAGYLNSTYAAFSQNLSIGILSSYPAAETDPQPALSPAAPSNTAVLYAHQTRGDTYSPFFTATPSESLTAPGFGDEENTTGDERPRFAGASADFADLLFEADGALTGNATEGGTEVNNLYESDGESLTAVNVLPGASTSEPDATFGAPYMVGPSEENSGPDLSHDISSDGSKIFWTSLEPVEIKGTIRQLPKALYVRENGAQPQSPVEGAKCTVPSDACTMLIASGGAEFQTASRDGTKVYFTRAGDLYEYDLDTESTTALTSGGEVQGVLGASEEGPTYVYFASRAALTPGSTRQPCEVVRNEEIRDESKCNLYLYQEGRPLTLITTLVANDGDGVWPFSTNGDHNENGDWIGDLGHRTAEVSPNGHSLVFMSGAKLGTANFPDGYENHGFSEVYVYSADMDSLICVSCSPSGEPPPIELKATPAAAYIPISHNPTYQPRVISADGDRVFFDSIEPLVAQDRNGKQDVYEWERQGTNGCARGGGCIYLLSGGTSTSASWLLDADAEGENVFVITRAQLVAEDQNENYDVYDARVGGVTRAPVAGCSGTGCQGVPAPPPIFATPATATFSGVGNYTATAAIEPKPKPKALTRAQQLAKALKSCMTKTRRSRRLKCQREAKKRYGAKPRSKAPATTRGGSHHA